MSTINIQSEAAQGASEIASAARQLLSQLPAADVSAESERAYRNEVSRLIKKSRSLGNPELWSPDSFWAAICDTRSKNTYYRRVAAVKFGLRIMLEGSLREGKTGALRFLIELAKKVIEAHGRCPITAPKRRHSKRRDIRGLPADWRESMLSEVQKTPHYLPFLVLAIAGCRAEELKKGVRVVIGMNSLALHIQGAKVKEMQGQPTRQIIYDNIGSNSHLLVQALHHEIFRTNAIDTDSYEMVVRIVGEKSGFSSAIRRAGRRLWPRRKREITPICLRHGAASDFKGHLDGDDVSIALGHCVDATKSRYGQRQMSSGDGGLCPSSVKADRPIRAILSSKPGRKVTMKP